MGQDAQPAPLPTLRALALAECAASEKRQGCRKVIRDLAKQIAGDVDDYGPLYRLIANGHVPGKATREGLETNRDREAREEWTRKVGAVLVKMLVHMDIVTGDVCRAEDRKFFGCLVETLSDWLGSRLPHATTQRTCERALEVLHRGGVIQSWRRSHDNKDGTFAGLASIRKISIDALLRMLKPGTLTWWDKVRRDESQRRTQAAKTGAPVDQAHAELRRIAEKAKPRRGDGDFQTGAGLAARILGRTGPPKPSTA